MRRNIEAYLLALHDSGGQLGSHHFLEEIFLARTADFKVYRQLGCKLHDAVIDERRPDLDGMGHAYAVRFHQDVVRKVVLLVELKERRDPVSRKPCSQTSEDIGKSPGQRNPQQSGFFRFGKGSVPVHVSPFRRHQAALEEAFKLVFKADFFVRGWPKA